MHLDRAAVCTKEERAVLFTPIGPSQETANSPETIPYGKEFGTDQVVWPAGRETLQPSPLKTEQLHPGSDPGFPHSRPPLETGGEGTGNILCQ